MQKCLHACRLCGGRTTRQFEKLILRKYQVEFHRCADCHSLQSDYPHWLDETYSDVRPIRDTGMARRTISLARWTSLIALILQLENDSPCIDWGGGNGLFCRLMRDRGFDFLSYDKFMEPFYSVGFTSDGLAKDSATLITCFEVFEHLPDPNVELEELFSANPDAVLCSTLLYDGQGEDWFYLAHEFGAHVFFYSREGMRQIGARFGYDFVEGVELHLFVKKSPSRMKTSRARRRLIQYLLGKGYSRRLAPVMYDAWRERRTAKYCELDRAKVQDRLFLLAERPRRNPL